MTNTEFASVIAYITSAIGKPLNPDAQLVYFDLLGDLPADVFQLAAKRVVLEHKWATFPSIAELRQAAAESVRGEVKELTPAEAWALAWKAARRIDLGADGSKDRALAGLPPIVVEAINAVGLASMTGKDEPVGVVRGQFLKVFEQLQGRERRLALMPPAVLDGIKREGIRAGQQQAITDTVAKAFTMPG